MKILLIPIFLVLFIACEKAVPLEEKDIESKIVVNSFISDGDTAYVHVSQSKSVLFDGSLPPIENASLKLFEIGGGQLGSFNYLGQGYYRLENYLPLSNKTYQLLVEATDFESVTCQTTVPYSFYPIQVDTNNLNGEYEYKITINDYGYLNNYYGILIENHYVYYDEYYEEYFVSINSYFSTSEIYVQNGSSDSGSEKFAEGFFFNGKSLSGNHFTFTGRQHVNEFSDSSYTVVKVMSLSEEYYKYLLSYDKYKNVNGDPFAQPVQVYSNIDKGFGIFGGVSAQSDTIFF